MHSPRHKLELECSLSGLRMSWTGVAHSFETHSALSASSRLFVTSPDVKFERLKWSQIENQYNEASIIDQPDQHRDVIGT